MMKATPPPLFDQPARMEPVPLMLGTCVPPAETLEMLLVQDDGPESDEPGSKESAKQSQHVNIQPMEGPGMYEDQKIAEAFGPMAAMANHLGRQPA